MWITPELMVLQGQDTMRWNPLVQTNQIVYVSKLSPMNRGQQGEKGSYLSYLISTRVRKDLIGISSLRQIKYYRFQNVHILVEPRS